MSFNHLAHNPLFSLPHSLSPTLFLFLSRQLWQRSFDLQFVLGVCGALAAVFGAVQVGYLC
jgi:hypothetical protein